MEITPDDPVPEEAEAVFRAEDASILVLPPECSFSQAQCLALL